MTAKRAAKKRPAKKAAPRGAAAARSEVSPEQKSIEFRGLTLDLPESLPATLMFDLVDLEDAGGDPRPIYRLLKSILGPDQFTMIRNVLTEDDAVGDAIDELLEHVFGQYGLGPGE